jgi:hypothetical protein
MNFLVIGTDHGLQERDPGFEGLLRALVKINFIQPLAAVGEEFGRKMSEATVARRVADEAGLRWINIDMTLEEREEAGILQDQRSRPISTNRICTRVPSDDIREEEWVRRLTESGEGTTIVICGYLHFDALVEKLRSQEHTVDQRVYLETLPRIEAVASD